MTINRGTGHVKTITMKMTNPKMDVTDMEVKALNILIGANGTGKSLILKMTWCFSFIMQAAVHHKEAATKELAQYVFDHSFASPDFDGVIEAKFESGSLFSCDFKKGKVETLLIMLGENVTEPTMVTFMSSNMRLFSSMERYLQLRKTLTGTPEVIQAQMAEHYPLYDVVYIERLIHKMPIKIDAELKDRFAAFDIKFYHGTNENPLELGVDLDKSQFYLTVEIDNRKERIPLSRFGSGHQALINMTIGGLP